MYCEECGRLNGHHPRCPNYYQRERIVGECIKCGNDIVVGEAYYETENGMVCEDCADEYYESVIESMKDNDYVEGEEE